MAFFAYATHYNLLMVVHNYPDFAVFQANHPMACIQPFFKLSSQILLRGGEIIAIASSTAQAVPPPQSMICPLSGSGSLCSKALPSLCLHMSLQLAASRGVDSPSFGVGPQPSGPLLDVPEYDNIYS